MTARLASGTRGSLLCLALALLAFLTGCDANDTRSGCPDADDAGTCYLYRAFDLGGTPLVEGHLLLDTAAADDDAVAEVNGIWTLDQITPGQAGPQVGTGFVDGRILGPDVLLRLESDAEPGMVELVGTLENGTIEGVWAWLQDGARVTEGPFTARAQD